MELKCSLGHENVIEVFYMKVEQNARSKVVEIDTIEMPKERNATDSHKCV